MEKILTRDTLSIVKVSTDNIDEFIGLDEATYISILLYTTSSDGKKSISKVYLHSCINQIINSKTESSIIGKIDYDSDFTVNDAVFRILTEETGIDFRKYSSQLKITYLGKYVMTNPIIVSISGIAIDISEIESDLNFTRDFSKPSNIRTNSEIIPVKMHDILNGQFQDIVLMSNILALTLSLD